MKLNFLTIDTSHQVISFLKEYVIKFINIGTYNALFVNNTPGLPSHIL